MNNNNKFNKYVAKVFTDRLKELGVSRYRVQTAHMDTVTRETFARVCRGNGGCNINTLAHYCDILGLEIIIKNKEDGIDYKQKFAR